MSRIGFLGTGQIAAPMARFLARTGHDILVSERNAVLAAALADEHGALVVPNQDVLDRSEIVFLCLRPQVAPEIIAGLTLRPDHRIVSVMAGISLADLRNLCAPATDITMTIPLGFLEQGGCPLPAFPNAELMYRLFAPENPVIAVSDEGTFNKHFAICAMVPGLLDLMAGSAEWLAADTGDRVGAEFYVTQLFSGFLAAMGREPDALAEARDALATEGSISLQMVEALRLGGVGETLLATLEAIGTR